MRFIISAVLFLSFCTFVKGQTQTPKYSDTAYHISTNKHCSVPSTVIIQNGLPKGGIRYTDPAGKVFVYAFFWTRVINETSSPLELTMNFPADSFVMRTQPNTYFKLFLTPDAMNLDAMKLDKEPLFDFGFADLRSFFDTNFNNPTELQRSLNPKEEVFFYIATLYNQGVDGVVRAALVLKGHELFYRISGEEIPCGQIVLRKWCGSTTTSGKLNVCKGLVE